MNQKMIFITCSNKHEANIIINQLEIMKLLEFDVRYYYNRYLNGENGKDLAKELDIHYASLLNHFKKNNLPVFNMKKHRLNHYYFSEINTHEKAYFLGLLYADGCVYKNKVLISLQDRDKHILKSFKNAIDFTGKLYFRQKTKAIHRDQYSLEMSSKILVKELRTLGCVSQKSNKLSEIPNINNKFINSFILGYFDGDGTLSKDKRTNSYGFSITGNKEMMLSIQGYFDSKNIFRKTNNVNKANFNKYTLDYKSIRSLKEIFILLYKNSEYYFYRKHNLFTQIIKSVSKRNDINKKVIQYKLDGTFIKEWNHINDIVKSFKLKDNSKIYKCLNGSSYTSMNYKWKYKT